MTKAVNSSIRGMIRRHRELYRKTDQLYEAGGDKVTETAEYNDAILESIDLENRIVATRTTSREDIAAKWAFICKTDFVSGRKSGDTGDLHQLVETILRLDAEAVGVSIPALEAEGITARRAA